MGVVRMLLPKPPEPAPPSAMALLASVSIPDIPPPSAQEPFFEISFDDRVRSGIEDDPADPVKIARLKAWRLD